MKKILYSLLLLGAVSLVSCEKNFLDINKDPYAITEPEMQRLLTAVEWEMGTGFAEGNFLNAHLGAYVHQTAAREIDNYALDPTYVTMVNTWNQLYVYVLKNLEELILAAEADETYIMYGGMAKVMKGFTFMAMTDLWGDIPYTEFYQSGNTTPALDQSSLIYNEALALFKSAVTDFGKVTNTSSKVGTADLFYGGDAAKWIKAANTLQLRLLVQSRKAKGQVSGWDATLNSLLADNNFIANGEDFQFPHSTTLSPQDERKTGFVDEYFGSQKSVWISPWFYEHMTGQTYNVKDNPFRGITDPRIPYYWFNQKSETADAQNPTDYRDGAFISIMFGSNSGYNSGTQEASMSVIGIYPVGGLYDNGAGGAAARGGTGIAPDRLMQAYSVPFMKAELVLAGDMSGDAATLLREGIEASIYHINSVAQAAKGTANVPAITKDREDVAEFIDEMVDLFNSANAEGKMRILMTQKWISNIYNSIEAYNDVRRTGYPTLFTGENNEAVSPYLQQNEAAPGPVTFTVISLRAFPRAMYYPDGEVQNNPNVTQRGNLGSYGHVFWDVQ